MNRRALAAWLLVSVVTAAAVLGAAFVWSEARKEVVFLCGNFTAGVSEASVVRQLETGHFLRYRRESMTGGSRIVVDSAWTPGGPRCTIELYGSGTVRRAGVE
jgi:hypothetical protein